MGPTRHSSSVDPLAVNVAPGPMCAKTSMTRTFCGGEVESKRGCDVPYVG